MSMKSVNPATGQVLQEYATLDDVDLEAILERAVSTQQVFAGLPVGRRAGWLSAAADRLFARREELARLMTAEMGKTFASALAEVDKCGWVCRYYVNTDPPSSRTRSWSRGRGRVAYATNRSVSFWPSCHGIFPCGRCSGSRHPP